MTDEQLNMDEFGPLALLAGPWVGIEGRDFSFHHDDNETGDTAYVEKITMNPFGPVDNGRQHLYGLDYRMTAWRLNEINDEPFHTEVGYWLYDPAEEQLMRCFMVPRGTVVIAGGTVAPDATDFNLAANINLAHYGVLQNIYLHNNARTESYEVSISIGNDEWTYEEDTVLKMNFQDELLHHTDRNTLKRPSASGF